MNEITIIYCPFCGKKMSADLHDNPKIDVWLCVNCSALSNKTVIMDREDIKDLIGVSYA